MSFCGLESCSGPQEPLQSRRSWSRYFYATEIWVKLRGVWWGHTPSEAEPRGRQRPEPLSRRPPFFRGWTPFSAWWRRRPVWSLRIWLLISEPMPRLGSTSEAGRQQTGRGRRKEQLSSGKRELVPSPGNRVGLYPAGEKRARKKTT